MKVSELKSRVDHGDKINYSEEKIDGHTVAALLRLYFRELPAPLVPYGQYQELIDLEGIKQKFVSSLELF